MQEDMQQDIAAWLLGVDQEPRSRTLREAGFSPDTIGVLRRLLQAFPGDPCGPAQQLVLAGAAVGLGVPDVAQSATITVEVQAVRARFDGGAATAAVGLLLPVGTVMQLNGRRTLQAASFFTAVAGGVVDVAYWT